MNKKLLTTTAIAATLGFSSFSVGGYSSVPTAQAEEKLTQIQHSHSGSPVDLGIANDERLIEMLKEEGHIAKGASAAQAEKALQNYLAAKAEGSKQAEKEQQATAKKLGLTEEKVNENGLLNGGGNKLGQVKKNKIASVKEEQYEGSVTTDKVLVLAIDFPDYLNSSITSEETDMFYEEYPKEHFEKMIFGPEGYEGPNSENLVSMKQYYEQQSGGSYTVEGEVAGWFTADHPAAYYGGNNDSDNDKNARGLVIEALEKAAEAGVDFADYDIEDRYDLDGDGEVREPDGLVDHLMIVHSGVGEEAGGGKLGADAIWSHRWSLAGPTTISGTEAEVPYWGGQIAAYDYTIEPEDGAAGVFAHEYGHDLGLPDEYDTIYSGAGEPVSYWSIMSSGSWAGKVPGTEPTGFSPYAREYLQGSLGGNWLNGSTVTMEDITSSGLNALLDEAVTKGINNDYVKINLPKKQTLVATPTEGEKAFFSGKGDEIDHSMAQEIDLTDATSAALTFDAWYNIEENWDYAMIQVSTDGGTTWKSLSSEHTNSDVVSDGYPEIKENMPGYTGSSNGWINESFDLSEYAGQKIQVQFRYMTDWGTNLDGLFVDNVKVTADGTEVFFDGAEAESTFDFHGFEAHSGTFESDHHYLLEWRSHNGVDEGLAHIRRGASLMSFDDGLVVWYVDGMYDNNWTGAHPGEGFLGVVDADQHTNFWSDGVVASTRYQVHDAAFSLEKSDKMFLDYSAINGTTLKDNFTQRNPLFDDSRDYRNLGLVDAGRNVPTYGLKFRVTGESADGTVGQVTIFK